jgi:hypothetical protein
MFKIIVIHTRNVIVIKYITFNFFIMSSFSFILKSYSLINDPINFPLIYKYINILNIDYFN